MKVYQKILALLLLLAAVWLAFTVIRSWQGW
jgi:hypothetical protein